MFIYCHNFIVLKCLFCNHIAKKVKIFYNTKCFAKKIN
nr:MAG TPA: hypothetical protein [Caudoviricetes sp.]